MFQRIRCSREGYTCSGNEVVEGSWGYYNDDIIPYIHKVATDLEHARIRRLPSLFLLRI